MTDFISATPTVAKEIGKNTGEIKTRLWIKLTVSHIALLEQIRSNRGFEDEHEAVAFCIMAKARELGLETG